MIGRVWVTGAQGFFGRAAADLLEAEGFDVVRIARRAWGPQSPGGSESGPIEDAFLSGLIARRGAPNLILHLAGNGAVGASFRDPAEDFLSSAGTTVSLLRVITRHAPQARLVFPSSAAVYGETGAGPIKESNPTRPVSPYGMHKLATEALCRLWAERYGLTIAVVRYFSLLGPGLRKQLFWDLGCQLRAVRGGSPMTLLGTGEETRDFLDVEDAVRLALHLHRLDVPGLTIVNGGSGRGTMIRRAAGAFVAALGRSDQIVFSGEPAPGAPAHLVADVTRLSALGFSPRHRFETSIARYADWFRSEQPPHA